MMRGLQQQIVIVVCMVATSMLLACAGSTTSDEMGGDAAATEGDPRVADADDPYNCGGPYSEAELDEAWAHFQTASGRGGAKKRAGSFAVRTGPAAVAPPGAFDDAGSAAGKGTALPSGTVTVGTLDCGC